MKKHTRSRFPLAKDVLKMITQVSRMEQHSTVVDLSQFVMVMQPECSVWTASGVNTNCVSEVLRMYIYGVCTVRWCFWHYHTKVQLHKSWSWNFLCMFQAQNMRHISKTENYKTLKINFLHVGTKHFYCVFFWTKISLVYFRHNADDFIFFGSQDINMHCQTRASDLKDRPRKIQYPGQEELQLSSVATGHTARFMNCIRPQYRHCLSSF
jgi:hypothetical protein